MTDHHSLLAGEWKLEAICGHVRGKLWWHVAARGKKNPKGTNTEENGFGKLKYEICRRQTRRSRHFKGKEKERDVRRV